MASWHEIIEIHDHLARQQVDDQLHFIVHGDPNLAYTSENTVYARDPLKPISITTDTLMVSPTVPLSASVDVSSGTFYSRGILYTFHGRNSGPLPLPHPDFTHILVALKIDTHTGDVTLYTGTEHGDLPMFHPDTLPLAIVRVHPGQDVIRSEDIIDIRPWINFDLSHPHDRVVFEVACLGPLEAISFDRRPYHQGAPLMAVYQKLSPDDPDNFKIVHRFDSVDSVIPLLNAHLIDVDDAGDGITLKKTVRSEPIELAGSFNVLFVSAQYGTSYGDGSKQSPVMTIDAAVLLYNTMPQFDTIYVAPGIYGISTGLIINRDVLIVGHSTEYAKLKILETSDGITCTGRLEIRTVSIYPEMLFDPATSVIKAVNLYLVNCVICNQQRKAITAILHGFNDLYIMNCVFDNPSTVHYCSLYHTPNLPVGYIYMHNLITLGLWEAGKFHISASILDGNIPGIFAAMNLRNPTLNDYRPLDPSICIDTGEYHYTGADLDGGAPDIGIYGGQYASYAVVTSYPINTPIVFKYYVQSMFSPIIKKFNAINLIANLLPPATQIYGAVSWDGGYKYCAWDETKAAWKLIDVKRIHEQGNTWDELIKRLTSMGTIYTKGEITIAWGLISTSSSERPILKRVDYTCSISPNALSKYPLDNLDVLVDDSTVMVRNKTEESINGLVFVCY